MKIAVIGLGTMGSPMAANLLAAGHDVVVHNRTRSREESLASQGAQRAASPAEAASVAEVLLTCVSDSRDVMEVLVGGEEAAIETLRPGALVIDCSTISPGVTRQLGKLFELRGVGFVDAPVSGGSEGAIKGTLAIMCGGTEHDFARARPILEKLGRAITHVGPVGAGQVAKAVNQVIIAGTYQALAEGLVLARKAGADPERVLDAVAHGAARSWVLENRAGNMIEDRYPLGFRLRLHRKDLAIALDAAREAGVSMPVAAYVAAAEDELIALGFGDDDMSALARAVRRAAAIPDGDLRGE